MLEGVHMLACPTTCGQFRNPATAGTQREISMETARGRGGRSAIYSPGNPNGQSARATLVVAVHLPTEVSVGCCRRDLSAEFDLAAHPS